MTDHKDRDEAADKWSRENDYTRSADQAFKSGWDAAMAKAAETQAGDGETVGALSPFNS